MKKEFNSKGFSRGAYIFPIKKNGEKYSRPIFHTFIGSEKNAYDIIKRLEGLNPGMKYEKA